MEIRKVSSAVTPTVDRETAKLSKGTTRFGRKLASKIGYLSSNIPKTFRNPDHQKFVNVSGEIQQESPEVAAIRKSLSELS